MQHTCSIRDSVQQHTLSGLSLTSGITCWLLPDFYPLTEGSVPLKTAKWLLTLLTVLTSGLALAQSPIIIKFSHVVAVDTPKGKAADFFARRASELTGGQVRVEVYANSSLYRDKEELEALQLGVVQMLAMALSKYSRLGLEEFEVFDLPYLFDSIDEVHKVTQGPLGAALLTKLESKGIKGLAFWDNGFKSFSANRPLKSPADFKGLRMRIQASNVLESQMRALGALPEAMAFSEVYQALQSGVVDGTENPHSNLYTQKMYEVQKHLTLTDHGYLGYVVITNRKFWDGLPAGVRGQLEQAMKEATAYENRIAQEENDQALAKLRSTGKMQIYTPTANERSELRKAMLRTHGEMLSRIGKETIEAIYRETDFNLPGR
jgi:C4-dicarboxylate-binding protein DctP